MAKVLKVTKSDKTTHIVPLANKPALLKYNSLLPAGQKWKFEEIDEKEAKNVPFIDESFVTAGEAQVKVGELQDAVAAREAKIKELEEKMAEMEAAQKAAAKAEAAEKAAAEKAAKAAAKAEGEK
jgi:peptidoglycan hydrolase CwlO-like protein